MFTTIISLLQIAAGNLWESFLVRLLLLAMALGAIPFYALSLAMAALGGN